jgi:hypothetical protein
MMAGLGQPDRQIHSRVAGETWGTGGKVALVRKLDRQTRDGLGAWIISHLVSHDANALGAAGL